MRKPIFTGAATAIVTPFGKEGVDFAKLEELIEYQLKEGIDAIVICGTTGEASTMPDDEHKSVIKFAVDVIKKRVPVIAGAGSNDTAHAVGLSQYAEKVGSDAILSVTPYYNKTTQRGLYCHFKAIAESIGIPIIIYNVPSRTNLNINPETLKDLALLPNIAGVKECNFNQVGDVINACGDNFSVYSGEDGLVVPMLSLGGKGVISVMSNIIPADTHKMTAKYFAGDIDGARKIQLKTLDLIKALFIEVNPIPVKAAMNLMGLNVGQCRMPLVDMAPSNLEVLRKALTAYGLL